jgi:membrane associated rhomboid family serine protease
MTFSITLIIIVITVAASFYAWNNQNIFQKWILNPYTVHHRKEYHRLITSGLIHNDYMHLAFNMIALYSFGTYVEQIYGYYFEGAGSLMFILLYVIGIIVSDIPTYIKHKNHAYYNSLGASGGVSAVVFSFILFEPMKELMLIFLPIPLPGFIFGGLYMLYSYVQARRGGDYINHDAHLFGALFGIIFSIIIMPSVIVSFFEQILNWRLLE